jgi:hypothetical protein
MIQKEVTVKNKESIVKIKEKLKWNGHTSLVTTLLNSYST